MWLMEIIHQVGIIYCVWSPALQIREATKYTRFLFNILFWEHVFTSVVVKAHTEWQPSDDFRETIKVHSGEASGNLKDLLLFI